ncbi:MAG: PqqD family protein [Gemmatimonadales bacterium]|nr:PqqD family protein [Gemmatimonadales bacterium]
MTTYRRHADLRLTSLEGEGVVLHLGARRYFTVTESGLTILEALVEPKSFDALVEAILHEYEIDRPKAEESTRKFLDECLKAALVEEVP